MFWSATGGGVRRYLLKKHAWLELQPNCLHSIAVPLSRDAPVVPWMRALPAWPIPRSGGYRLPVGRRAIACVLCEARPSLIEAADPYRVAWGSLDAARALDIPAVAFCHSNLERVARMAAGRRFGPVAGAAARRYAKRLYDRFDLVLAPSQAMRSHLLDWGVQAVACQPLGVDTDAFVPVASKADWRQAHGFTEAHRILVFAGRFAPEKNLHVLADAVRSLGPPYVLLAIGAGPTPPPAGAHVRVLPFMPAVAGLAAALAAADAFVHAGDQETFGLSALEAMACGLPVVARAAEGLAELVDASVGIGVGHGTPAAFAESVAALFAADPQARGLEARRRAEAHDWNAVLPMLLRRYRALVGHAWPSDAVEGDALPAPASRGAR